MNTTPPRSPTQPSAARGVSTPTPPPAAHQSRTEGDTSLSDRIADLEHENELLRHGNELLLEGIAGLSAGYLTGQLREQRREIDQLKRRERDRDTRINNLEDSLLKARQAFAKLQQSAEKEPKV